MRVEMGAVKKIEAGSILWKVGRYPVEYNAYFVEMSLVNKVHEIFRGAKTTGRCKKTKDLISP